MLAGEQAPEPLHPDIERGLRWTAIRQIVTTVAGTAGTLVYAHALTPDALGAASLALLVYEGLFLLIRVPIQHAVVYFQHDAGEHPSAAVWLRAAFSRPAAAIVVVAAPWLGQFYQSDEAAALTQAITVAFLFMSLATVPGALLVKQMRFALYETFFTIYQLMIMIGWVILSLRGFGAWSLILPVVAASAVWCAGVWASAWLAMRFRPTLRPGWQAVREVFNFARNVWGSQLLIYLMWKMDNAAVGTLGERPLGYYAFGEDQSAFVAISVGTVVAGVTLPALARVQDDLAAFRGTYLKMLRLIAAAATPMQVGALVIADLGLTLFFGSQWAGAVPVFRAYVAFQMVDVFNDLSEAATSAIGRPDLRLKLNIVQLPFFVLGTWFGLTVWGGILGVAAALAVVRAIAAMIYLLITWRLLRVSARAVIGALAPSSAAALVMGMAALGVRRATPDGWIGMIATIVVAAPLYFGLLYVLDRDGFIDVMRIAAQVLVPPGVRARVLPRMWARLKVEGASRPPDLLSR